MDTDIEDLVQACQVLALGLKLFLFPLKCFNRFLDNPSLDLTACKKAYHAFNLCVDLSDAFKELFLFNGGFFLVLLVLVLYGLDEMVIEILGD